MYKTEFLSFSFFYLYFTMSHSQTTLEIVQMGKSDFKMRNARVDANFRALTAMLARSQLR